jgi:hypothetical protein
VTVAYDDRDALDRSRQPGAAVVDAAAREADLDVLDECAASTPATPATG